MVDGYALSTDPSPAPQTWHGQVTVTLEVAETVAQRAACLRRQTCPEEPDEPDALAPPVGGVYDKLMQIETLLRQSHTDIEAAIQKIG